MSSAELIQTSTPSGWIVMCKETKGSGRMALMGLTPYKGDAVLMMRSWATVYKSESDAKDALNHMYEVGKKYGFARKWAPSWRVFSIVGIAEVGQELVPEARP